MAIATAAQTVSVRLMGESQICALSRTGSTEMQIIRSSALTMPSKVTNLYVEMKSAVQVYKPASVMPGWFLYQTNEIGGEGLF